MVEVFRVKEEMNICGIKLNFVIYVVLIGGMCRIGDIDKGKDLLNEMIKLGLNFNF